jgi:hypothetical protein
MPLLDSKPQTTGRSPTTDEILRLLPRRLRRDRVWRRWTVAWLGGSVLGIANGAVRDLLYKNRVGDLGAHQLSTATLLALLTWYLWVLERRWPIPTTEGALAIGGTWLVLTVLFEFGFGHYVTHDSWSQLLGNYDLAHGRVWALVPLWMALGPAAVRRLHAARR